MKLTRCISGKSLLVGLLSLGTAGGAFAQADAEQKAEEQQAVEEQADQTLRELFKDFELQIEEIEDPHERNQEQRQQLEDIQRRIIELRRKRQLQPGVIAQERAAQPVQLEAEPYISPWLERSRADVVSALNHKDFAVRQSAEAHLLGDSTLSSAAIKQLLKEANSPEQRHRLIRVAEHHVLREIRERDFGQANKKKDEPGGGLNLQRLGDAGSSAAIGYSYEPVLARENPHADLAGVRVIATMPGFPGHAHLRKGDLIVSIDGQTLSNAHQQHDITAWVRWRISVHDAGDEIDFTVIRDGKPLAIKLICAEGAALNSMYTTDAFEAAARKAPYEQAWREAREAMTAELPKPKALTPAK